jgi:hypothetical protein
MALMLAAYSGHAELVCGLLKHGADPNCLNDCKQALIAGTVFKHKDEVVCMRVLVEVGTDLCAGSQTRLRAYRCSTTLITWHVGCTGGQQYIHCVISVNKL